MMDGDLGFWASNVGQGMEHRGKPFQFCAPGATHATVWLSRSASSSARHKLYSGPSGGRHGRRGDLRLNGGSGRQQKTNAACAPAFKCPSHCNALVALSPSIGGSLWVPGNSTSSRRCRPVTRRNARRGLFLSLPSGQHMCGPTRTWGLQASSQAHQAQHVESH